MDLFSDFSFAAAGAPSRRSAYLHDLDMEEISPSSSRSTTPVAGDLPRSPRSPLAPPVTVDQLSARLNHHHIDMDAAPFRGASGSVAPLCVRLQKAAERRAAAAGPAVLPGAEHFNAVRRHRVEGARTLCSGARLASIETLVDRMLRDGSSCYASLHPSSGSAASSRNASRQNSVTSAPTSMPSPSLRRGSDDTTSDEDEDPLSPALAVDPRLAKLRFGCGAAAAVRRSGVEKSGKPRRKATAKR